MRKSASDIDDTIGDQYGMNRAIAIPKVFAQGLSRLQGLRQTYLTDQESKKDPTVGRKAGYGTTRPHAVMASKTQMIAPKQDALNIFYLNQQPVAQRCHKSRSMFGSPHTYYGLERTFFNVF
jgi:hypothetical protein